MTVEKIIEAITSQRETKYSNKLYTGILEKIARRYSSELIDHYLIKIDRVYLGKNDFIRIRGSKAVFKTGSIETAFKIRNLMHSSGYKNSRVKLNGDYYIVISEAPDNIILSNYFIDKLRMGDEYFIRLISKFLKDVFLRNIKRIKLLLKNTKF